MTFLERAIAHVDEQRARCFDATAHGRVARSVGLLLEVVGVRAAVGALCWIELNDRRVPAEVVGFDVHRTLVMPLGQIEGVDPGTKVCLPTSDADTASARPERHLGRVIDGLGAAIDGGGPIAPGPATAARVAPISPMGRSPIGERLDVGVRSLNALLSVGVGQRLGLFAGSGVGKSVLLGMLARHVQADVVVVGLIGERGREVQEFVLDNLGESIHRAVVVACPADDSAALRLRGARLATQIAERFRGEGKNVLLLMDSLTRVAQAQREIGLAMGEPPTAKGYTPSSFACLPKLVERAGTSAANGSGGECGGAITAFYTVLMEEDDLNDPIVDAARAILDGHVVLSRRMADLGIYPAVDVGRSISRVMPRVTTQEQQELARRFKALWSRYEEQEDLISIGAYQPGSDAFTDEAIARRAAMTEFLRQDANLAYGLPESEDGLAQIFNDASAAPGMPVLAEVNDEPT